MVFNIIFILFLRTAVVDDSTIVKETIGILLKTCQIFFVFDELRKNK